MPDYRGGERRVNGEERGVSSPSLFSVSHYLRTTGLTTTMREPNLGPKPHHGSKPQ
jgi:hypothetical protein